jgi:5-methylcytosine-specific restriction endonuclease McrBC regulatory subunit McrC
LNPPPQAEPVCFELTDCSTVRLPAALLQRGPLPRDPNPQAARLARQFIDRNRGVLANVGVSVEPYYDGNSVELTFRTQTRVGAVPLLSPTTGKPDYGLVIKPRFPWPGLGAMLGVMGWRIVPTPLRLPLLPRSERKLPAWVLSAIVLVRLQALLDRLERRFEIVSEDRPAPRGSVDWAAYATRHVSRGQFLQVPCRFPDLRDDRDLKAAIAFTLGKQVQSLQGQRQAGVFVLQLLALAETLLRRVQDVPPRPPSPVQLDNWLRGPLRTEVFRDGLQAVEWTVEDRGLAGLSDLEGLPWVLPMEAFFEAWMETVLARVARTIGGTLRTGRRRQTLAALQWEPPYAGSQKYLLPDLILERGPTTILVDAKYKEHWEEMATRTWGELEEELRERHRADLLQVLAYANLATTPEVVVCLAYPCRQETWDSLAERGRLFHRATLTGAQRRVEVMLTAVPMQAKADPMVDWLAKALTSGQ